MLPPTYLVLTKFFDIPIALKSQMYFRVLLFVDLGRVRPILIEAIGFFLIFVIVPVKIGVSFFIPFLDRKWACKSIANT